MAKPAKTKKPKEGVPAFYQTSGGPKAVRLHVPPTGERVWILEFHHPEYEKWLFLERGRGMPVGPFTEQRALDEMIAWVRGSGFADQEGARLVWRIRNLKTGEEIHDAIVS